MRQIEIGLYVDNIIWVDDNIFNSDWANKELMEIAYYNSKILKIKKFINYYAYRIK